jgi:hypothetical protein
MTVSQNELAQSLISAALAMDEIVPAVKATMATILSSDLTPDEYEDVMGLLLRLHPALMDASVTLTHLHEMIVEEIEEGDNNDAP